MDRIYFKVNGVQYSVGCEVSSDVTLVDYLRDYLELRGTKYMCRQAGCGACIVAAARTPGSKFQAVNSCMVSITSCYDWEIETIEELGNRNKGYHIIQKALASNNGSQCGHCSPGWVMAMYCFLQETQDLTMLNIEKAFGSNVCRCTGYRPILQAFKTFAKDAPESDITDIEDLKICNKTGGHCNKSCNEDDDWCIVRKSEVEEGSVKTLKLKDGRKWYRVTRLAEVHQVFKEEGVDSYMLVAGNTAKGAYPILEYPKILIDINGISDLNTFLVDQNLVLGSGITLTELLRIYKSLGEKENFAYLMEFYDHLELVAHIAVRNLGTIGGNLMIKHQHNEFQSDLYLMFETVGAVMTISTNSYSSVVLTMEQFLRFNMRSAVIVNVKLPPLGSEFRVKTFKVMPRSQNAHALVNFGSLYEYANETQVVRQCRLVYGGLSAVFNRAKNTEKLLIGKQLFTNETLQAAIKMLHNELVVVDLPPESSVMYRRKLAIGLFYKSLLALCPEILLYKKYKSGAIKLIDARPVSTAVQTFETKPALWPLNKPLPKLEALIQCAGEAFYCEDMPTAPRQVYGDLVLSTVSRGSIVAIDKRKALAYPGVLAVYTSQDIPGLNSFTPADDIQYTLNEEVLCSGEVCYYNQPIAIVVAETRHIAELATKLVGVAYKNVSAPVLDVNLAKNDPSRVRLLKSIPATDKGMDTTNVIKGSNTIYGQYHFTMETIACVVRPTEEGLEVYVTSQWPDAVQTMISRALNMDASRIDVHIRRIGGGYGIKISRSILVAVAASLVVVKLNRPCRIILSMPTVSRAFGKRFPCSSDYEVGVNETGVIQYLNYKVFEDNGFTVNEKLTAFGVDVYYNVYEKSRWNYESNDVITDTAKNTWFRSPGTLESIAFVEMIMEQISYELNLDPIELRMANLDPKYNTIKEMSNTLLTQCNYSQRRAEVHKFNMENRWKKRGLRVVPLKWDGTYPRYFDTNISVYHADGTVSIVHGGVEIGQGINTRAAQVCAYALNIPLEKIQVKSNNTISCPNGAVTGGSITSQNIVIAVLKACKQLLGGLEPVRSKMHNPSWEELVAKAFKEGVDLQAHGFAGPNDKQTYNVYGVTAAEVEIDVLTGETVVRRVDMMYDAGQSVNPEIDIGQAEGAFIMGLGYWMTEQLVYDKNTGEVLTDRPWNYNVPLARDIPQDFRVHLKKNSYSTPAILGSKAAGEPPMCMAVVIPFAIREAVTASRYDSGIPTTSWFPQDGPTTVEWTCLEASTQTEEFKFYN